MNKTDSKNQLCQLHLVRHGQTEWNQQHRFQGHQDSPLTKEGIAQAKQLAQKLHDVQFDAVYSSDLDRAKRTADIISLEQDIAVTTTALLRERYLGALEGKTRQELSDKLQTLLEHLDEIKTAQHQADADHRIEPLDHLHHRTITFLRQTAIAHPGEKVLVVTHGGVIGHLLISLGYQNLKSYFQLNIDNLSSVILKSDGVDFFIEETIGIEVKPII